MDEPKVRRAVRLILSSTPLLLFLTFVGLSLNAAWSGPDRMKTALACLFIAWITATIATYVVAEPYWDEHERRRILVTVITSVGAAAICIAVGVYELGFTSPSAAAGESSGNSTNQQGGQTGGTIINNGPVYNGPTASPSKPEQHGAIIPSLDYSIRRDCTFGGPKPSPDQMVDYLLVSGTPANPLIGWVHTLLSSAANLRAVMPLAPVECKYTNVGATRYPAFKDNMKIEYFQSIKTERGSKPGDLLYHASSLTPDEKILEVGDSVTFYIVNNSPFFIQVIPQQAVQVMVAGDGNWHDVKPFVREEEGKWGLVLVPFSPSATLPTRVKPKAARHKSSS